MQPSKVIKDSCFASKTEQNVAIVLDLDNTTYTPKKLDGEKAEDHSGSRS